jgi:flagellar M-ring protein FliF
MARKVETMLAAVIGPGNAVVRVSAEIDTDATVQTSEKFDPDGQVVRSQTTVEDVTSSAESRTAGGAVGVSANVPEKNQGTAETARPLSTSEQNRKNSTTTYEINRATTNVTRSPGTVKSMTAAVFIAPQMVTPAPAADAPKGAPAPEPQPQKRSPQELEALRQIVVNALGIKAAPGQTTESLVSLQELPFQAAARIPAQVEAIAQANRWQGWIDAARGWTPVVGAAAVLFLFWRTFRRQKPEAVPVEVLSLTPAAARSLPSSSSTVTPELLNELIRHKPANVGVALRDWVAAGTSPGAGGKN